MMKFLLDTNIIIYSRKNNEFVNQWLRLNRNCDMFISIITYAELLFGAHKSKNKLKNLEIVEKIGQLFNVINIDIFIIQKFAKIKADLSSKGIVVDDFDLLIASSALCNDLVLATNNLKHFENIPDLKIINPLS